MGKQSGYVVWGVDNETLEVVGTSFKPSSTKYKQQELESWLLQKTAPKIHFRFYEFENEAGLPVVILEIQAATHTPVQLDGTEYIRVGSYTKKLRDFAEKERELWRVFDKTPFERQMATENSTSDEVLSLLDYPAYFELTKQPLAAHSVIGFGCTFGYKPATNSTYKPIKLINNLKTTFSCHLCPKGERRS